MPQLDKLSFMSQVVWFFSIFFLLYLIFAKSILPAIARALKLRLRVLGYFGVVGKGVLGVDTPYKTELVQYAEQSFLFLKNLSKHIRLYALAVRIQRELKVSALTAKLKPLARGELLSLIKGRSKKLLITAQPKVEPKVITKDKVKAKDKTRKIKIS